MKNMKKSFTKIILLVIAILAVYITIPRVLDDYFLSVFNFGLLAALMTYGVAVMLGMGGQLSFAAVSFMGIGAYVVANLCSDAWHINLNPIAGILLGVLCSTVIAFLLGLLLFKLSGTYFTFSTIAVVSMTYALFLNYKPLFGGAEGMKCVVDFSIFGAPVDTYQKWFYFLFTLVIICGLLVERIRRTRLGRSLFAIRDNETAAKTLGINTYMTKVIAFTIAGTLSGLSGALYCMHGSYAVSDLFTWNNATQYIIMAMLGGVNNTVGVVIGSLIVKIVPEVFRTFQQYVQFLWGIMIILLMIFMPEGCAGIFKSAGKMLKSGKMKKMQQKRSDVQ